MKKAQNSFLTLLLVFGTMIATPSVFAQSGKLHHIQSQALLAFSFAEAKLVNAALSSREFDMSLSQDLIKSLATSLRSAKKHVDKTTDLLSEKQEKLRPRFEKLRAVLVTAEREVETLSKDVESQVKPFLDAMEAGDEDGAEPPPEPNWEALKKHVAWIVADISQAQRIHKNLAKKLRVSKLRTPRKPKGKRE